MATITIEISAEQKERLQIKAEKAGLPLKKYCGYVICSVCGIADKKRCEPSTPIPDAIHQEVRAEVEKPAEVETAPAEEDETKKKVTTSDPSGLW